MVNKKKTSNIKQYNIIYHGTNHEIIQWCTTQEVNGLHIEACI